MNKYTEENASLFGGYDPRPGATHSSPAYVAATMPDHVKLALASKGPPADVMARYLDGDCMWLAQALHRRFGWQIRAQMAWAGEDAYVVHAYCVMPDGRELDIRGPQDRISEQTDDVWDWDARELLATMEHDDCSPRAVEKLEHANTMIDIYIVPLL